MSFLLGLVIGFIAGVFYLKTTTGNQPKISTTGSDSAGGPSAKTDAEQSAPTGPGTGSDLLSSAAELRTNASRAIDAAVEKTSAAGAAAGQAASKVADKASHVAAEAAGAVSAATGGPSQAQVDSLSEELSQTRKALDERDAQLRGMSDEVQELTRRLDEMSKP